MNPTALQVRCRVCGWFGPPAEYFRQAEAVRCAACRSVQSLTLPSVPDLEQYYGRYLADYPAGMGRRRYRSEMHKRYIAKLRLLEKWAPRGCLLDVGCADGMFVELAARFGFEAVGCDYAVLPAYPPGVRVLAGRVDAAGGLPFDDESFTAVTCWATLEHVREPDKALQEMSRVLARGGVLACDTPLSGDFCELLFPGRSHWIAPPEHLHIFSSAGLRRVVESSGLRVLTHRPYYERSVWRWLARRGRNLVAAAVGGALWLGCPHMWRHLRQTRTTQLGDIQLLIAEKC